jgi:nucleoid DNA-binding protein
MRHSELIKRCSSRTGIAEKQVKLVIKCFFEEILFALSAGESVKVAKFGTFERRYRVNSEGAGYIKVTQSRLVKRLLGLFDKIKTGEQL